MKWNHFWVAAIALTLVAVPGFPQATGDVTYPYLGIKFTIPEDWMGQELEEGYLMGSNTEAGFIFMMLHEAQTIEEMKTVAQQGIQEEGGTLLTLTSSLQEHGSGAIGGTFEGTVEYNPAKGYVIGVLNPFGSGVTIMAVTSPDAFSERYQQLAEEVALSLKFAAPKESSEVKEWKEALKGAKLTYLSSYDGSGYGSYGGSNSRSEILLCSDQSFSYYSSSFVSVDTGGAFGSAGSQDNGYGRWQVTGGVEGDAVLQLSFDDGREHSYDITYKDSKTLLNGSRYFRTYDHGQCR